jgi:hypothetical protein
MTPLSRRPDLSVINGAWVKKDPFRGLNSLDMNRGIEHEFCFAVADDMEDEVWRLLQRFRVAHDPHIVPVPHETLLKAFPFVAADWNMSRFGELAFYRNMLLDKARELKPDQAIFVDSDMVPPRGFLDRLRADGKDVCAGMVKTFNNNWDEVYGYGTFREPWFTGLDWRRHHDNEGNLLRVDFANSACLALGWRVLADERAKFEPLWVDFQGAKVLLSEDSSFCRLLGELGYRIWVDELVRCSHLRKTPRGTVWLGA